MSCLSEIACAVYVDGELPAEELRQVESHLVGCNACRARILALREETELLARALQEEVSPEASLQVSEPDEPARSGGLVAALALSVAALAGVGALGEAWLAGADAASWLHPAAALRRGFELLLVLRSQAPGIFELAVALAATVSVSALATFALSVLLRRLGSAALISAVLLCAALVAAPAAALEVFRESRTVAAEERVEGSLVGHADRFEVDGVVAGDVFILAETATIRGRVEGNVWVWAEDFELTGEVDGNLFVGAHHATLAGVVRGSVHLGGKQLRIAEDASIERDAWLLADHAAVEGRIGRDAVLGVEHFELSGRVGRDLDAWAGRLTLAAGAEVAGNLVAALPRGVELEIDPGARVGGEQRVVSIHEKHRRGLFAQLRDPSFWLWRAIRVAAAFVAGLLLYAWVPMLFRVRFATARGLFRRIGIGLAALGIAVLGLPVVALTLVGLPVALFGVFAFLTGAYVGGILVAARVGDALLRPEPGSLRAFGLALLTGLVVLALVTALPFVGGAVRVLALLAGLGMGVETLLALRGSRSIAR